MPALLPIATFAHALGLVLADRGLVAVEAAVALALVGLVAGLLPGRSSARRAGAAVLVIGSCGALAMASQRRQASRVPLPGPRDAIVDGSVCGSRVRGRSFSVDLCDCVAAAPGAAAVPHKLRIFESVDPERRAALASLRSGQRVRARLRLTPIAPSANPGARGSPDAYARRGIGARASLRDAALLVRMPALDRFGTHGVGAAWGRIARWRRSIGERLSAAGPGGGLARALVLGDRSTLPHDARDAFARIGIGHLLAVSGLHLALVAGLAFALVRRGCLRLAGLAARRDPRRLALLGAFVCALAYALMSGWGIPVRRALLFLTVAGLAVASRRTVGALQLLCLAALPLLIVEPHALFEMGAQLSFVASAGLLLARRNDAARPLWIAAPIRTSATAIAATLPWLAWHAGSVGVFAVAANFFAVPWVGWIVLPASLAAACAAALPETALTGSVIAAASGLGAFTLSAVTSAAAVFPASPGGSTPSPGVLAVAGALCALALWVRRTGGRVALCTLASALLALAPARVVTPAPPRLVSFAVGQGDATLIEGRSGALLVDGGRAFGASLDMGRQVVVPGLAALNVDALDLVIASHADLDHRGGLDTVLERVPTGWLWLPYGARELPDFRKLLAIAARRGVEVRETGRGGPAQVFGDLRVIPLWPPREGAPRDRNDSSLVVRVEIRREGEFAQSILLTGDLGVAAERRLIEGGTHLRSTVLKAGHHGSRGSSSREFLLAVRPDIALVSAPCHGRAGLPSAEAMDRLEGAGARVWWSGRSGAVIVGFATQSRPRVARGWHANLQCRVH